MKYIYPLRELEICLDNSYPNSLQLYFKKNNHIIQCESNEERKEIKAELEKKRSEFSKWEQDNINNFFATQENKFKELVEANSNLLQLNKENKEISEDKDNKEINELNEKNEIKENKKEELFGWQ